MTCYIQLQFLVKRVDIKYLLVSDHSEKEMCETDVYSLYYRFRLNILISPIIFLGIPKSAIMGGGGDIITDLNGIGCENVDCVVLGQYRVQWRTAVNTTMNVGFHKRRESFD